MRDGAAPGAVPGRGRSAERFDAFISYSRGDEPVAAALERAMERYATPFFRRRRLSVFRDATSMTVDPDLWEAITHPMDRARLVIVLCSGHAVGSKWVNREIEYCITSKGIDHLVPVVLEGTWRWDAEHGRFAAGDDVGVPPALIGAYDAEPLYSDLRSLRGVDPKELRRDRAFRTELTKLVSRVTGTPVEQLAGEERTLRRRTLQLFAGAFALVTALAVLAGAMAVRASTQEGLARDREQEAIAARNDAVDARNEAVAAERDALDARDEAEASEARARAEARRSLASALAGASGDQLDVDRSLALLLAGTAQQLDPGSTTDAALLGAVVAESRSTGRFDPWTAAGDGVPELLALSPTGRYAAFARFVNGFQGSQVTFVEVTDGFRILGSTFGGADPTVVFGAQATRAVILGGGPPNSTRDDREGRPIIGDDLRAVDLEQPAADGVDLRGIQPPPFAADGYARARMAVSGDGRIVAVGRRDGTLHVEDLGDGTATERLVAWDVPVSAVAVSEDGSLVAAVSGETVTVFATDRDEPLASYPVPRAFTFAPPSGAVALAFAGANDRLAMVTSFGSENLSGSLLVVDTLSGFPITRVASFGDLDPDDVSLVVSQDGSLVAAGATNSAVLDLGVDDGPPVMITGRVLAIDTPGRRVLTDDPSGRVTARSVIDGRALALPFGPESGGPGSAARRVVAAAFHGDGEGERIVTAGSTLVTWRPGAGPPAASFVPSAAALAGALDDGTLVAVADQLGARATRLDGSTGAATELPDGPGVESREPLLLLEPGAEVTTLAEVDPASGAVVRRRTVPEASPQRMSLVAVAPDRSTIVVVVQPIGQVAQGSDLRERRMIVLDVSGDAPIELPVESLGTGLDVLATFTDDSQVLLVDDGAALLATDIGGDGSWREVLTTADTITSVARAASGALLIGTSAGDLLAVPASQAGSDGATRSWAPGPVSVLARLPGIVAMWPSPDRPWAAIQSADGAVRVIDTDRGELVVELPEATAATSAAWAGDLLALALGDGIHLWDLSVERALGRVCALADRELSAEERARYGIDAAAPTPACG